MEPAPPVGRGGADRPPGTARGGRAAGAEEPPKMLLMPLATPASTDRRGGNDHTHSLDASHYLCAWTHTHYNKTPDNNNAHTVTCRQEAPTHARVMNAASQSSAGLATTEWHTQAPDGPWAHVRDMMPGRALSSRCTSSCTSPNSTVHRREICRAEVNNPSRTQPWVTRRQHTVAGVVARTSATRWATHAPMPISSSASSTSWKHNAHIPQNTHAGQAALAQHVAPAVSAPRLPTPRTPRERARVRCNWENISVWVVKRPSLSRSAGSLHEVDSISSGWIHLAS